MKLQQRFASTRAIYTTAFFLLAASLVGLTSIAHGGEPGVMLRTGNYSGHGGYAVPDNLAQVQPAKWPVGGWYRLTSTKTGMVSTAVASPAHAMHAMPDFLVAIAAQTHRARFDTGDVLAGLLDDNDDDANGDNNAAIYLRLPEVKLRSGELPVYRFNNGTLSINPILDHRYSLSFHGQPFVMTVRNGFKTRDGRPYGRGAQYSIEYNGQKYEYSLGTQGWASRILAVMDVDGDGKPDFHISTGDGVEYLLLSSQAKPGRNAPSASLASVGGC